MEIETESELVDVEHLEDKSSIVCSKATGMAGGL